jgi:hypothetical protein
VPISRRDTHPVGRRRRVEAARPPATLDPMIPTLHLSSTDDRQQVEALRPDPPLDVGPPTAGGRPLTSRAVAGNERRQAKA